MSTRKLLISAAAAALTAGTAAALGVTQGDANTATPGQTLTGFGTPGLGVYLVAAAVAEEATLAASGSNIGLFELDVAATGTFAASENYFVDVTVSGGTFSQVLTGAEVTDGATLGSISGSSVQIAGQAQTGQIGENAVRYLVSTNNAASSDFGIEMPIAYSGCPNDLTFTVSIETTSGVTFEEGTVTLTAPALTCVNGYLATIASDVTVPANDSVLASTTFTNFVAGTTTSATDDGSDGTTTAGPVDTTVQATLGTITVDFNPTATTASILTAIDGSTPPLTGLAAEVTDVEFDVNVSDATGLSTVDTTEVSGTPVSIASGSATLTDLVPGVLTTNNHIENIELVVTGAAQVAQQAVTTSNGVLSFGVAGIVTEEAVADATLDDLNYEGEICGTFDWVGDASKPTQNIFRVTGFGTSVTDVIATLTNSSEGINGSMTLTEPYDFTAPELVITASHLTDVFGDFGRADVLFNFIGSSTALDCDRLMNSDSANIITAFGNNNSTATTTADGDD